MHIKNRARSACKIFVKFVLLPPFGQWAYGESRVQKNLVSPRERPAANKIREIRVRLKDRDPRAKKFV